MEQHEAPDLWSAFAMAVFAVNGLIIQAGESISRPLGQSSARWQVLGRVYRPQTVPDIARDIGLARQSVQRTADLLTAEGLVCFRAHPSDRRTRLVELTPEGHRVLAEIYRRQVAWSARILEHLDPATLRDVSRTLTAVAAVLRHALDMDQDPQPED